MPRKNYIVWQSGMVVAVKIFPRSTTTLRTPTTLNRPTTDTGIRLSHRTRYTKIFMRTTGDKTGRTDPAAQTDATVGRRSFLKSAAAAAVFGAAVHTL